MNKENKRVGKSVDVLINFVLTKFKFEVSCMDEDFTRIRCKQGNADSWQALEELTNLAKKGENRPKPASLLLNFLMRFSKEI